MELQGKRCALEPFSAAEAAIRTGFDAGSVVDILNQDLARHLSRAGLVVEAVHPARAAPEIVVEGQFVRIDEGSRWQRYFLTFMGGAAVVEVEGELYHDGVLVAGLYAQGTQGMGLFGGGGRGLLKRGAAGTARQIANQIIEALAAR